MSSTSYPIAMGTTCIADDTVTDCSPSTSPDKAYSEVPMNAPDATISTGPDIDWEPSALASPAT